MKKKHTPVPWFVGMRGGYNADIVYDRSGKEYYEDKSICQLHGLAMHRQLSEMDDSEELANARLIAAAPELLEACEAFVEAWEKCLQLEKTDVALRMAKDAIAKAKGEMI